jgi:hypothetical protein
MILEKQKESMIVTDGDEVNESIGMSLDMDSAQILMQMLSKNLYSDAIGSTIRETVSNSIDSHRKAGIDDPVVVRFSMNSNNDYEFSVEDFGIGLDADDVRNIISKYGKSTKRNSNIELGMFGLGWKSPLAYSSSFYFVCRKDGMERKYMMYEGEDVNTIDLLYEVGTSERNGVKVIVPVRWADRHVFFNKIKEQLAYFENVYFDVNVNGNIVKNDFKIYRGEHFQYSELIKDRNLHICLDNVYYPIDFAKLNLGAIEFPIALRFSLSDGLFPTPNREALRYSQEAKEIILKKIESVADYFVEKYNEEMKECEDYEQIYQHYTSYDRKVEVIPGVELNVKHLSALSVKQMISPKMKGVEHLNMSKVVHNNQFILNEYRVRYILNRGKMKEINLTGWEADVSMNRFDKDNFYIYTDKITEMKKSYLRDTLSYKNFYFIRKTKDFRLFPKKNSLSNYDNYYNILELKSIPRKNWRAAIIEFQNILKSIVAKWENTDELDVPQWYVDQKKKSRAKGVVNRRQKLEGDIIVKMAAPLERYMDKRFCKFVPDTWKLKDIPKMKALVVYAHHDDYLLLDRLYGISLNTKSNMKFITLSTREMKLLEEMEFQNVISYSKFMEGKTQPFKRLVTAYLINQLKNKYNHTFGKLKYLTVVNKSLAINIDTLDDYRYKNYKTGNIDLYEEMMKVAEEHKLFDYSIYYTYLKVKKKLKSMYFIETFMGKIDRWGKETPENTDLKMLADLMKYHKFRVEKEFYKKPESVDEELLEDLVNQ